MPHELYVRTDTRPGLIPILRPIDAAGQEAIYELSQLGADHLRCVVTAPRNSRRNRWFHALLTIVAQAYDQPMEAIKVWLKMRLHLVDTYRVDDRVIDIPKSVSFAAMDETEFAQFCNRCVELIARELLGGIEQNALRAQIEEMIGATTRARITA